MPLTGSHTGDMWAGIWKTLRRVERIVVAYATTMVFRNQPEAVRALCGTSTTTNRAVCPAKPSYGIKIYPKSPWLHPRSTFHLWELVWDPITEASWKWTPFLARRILDAEWPSIRSKVFRITASSGTLCCQARAHGDNGDLTRRGSMHNSLKREQVAVIPADVGKDF